MNCQTHVAINAVGTCTGCAEGFCADCLVAVKGSRYCGACKTMAIPRGEVRLTGECAVAGEALKYAIIGIFCLGIILEPMAIAKALEAKRLIAADPTLGGLGKANAALVIAAVVMVVWVVSIIARINGAS